MNSRVSIVPLGTFDKSLLEEVAENIRETFGMPAGFTGGDGLPSVASAYDTERGQYSAAELLCCFDGAHGEAGGTLFLTDLDLYFPGLNHVFGYAEKSRNIAIVSLARLKKGCREVNGNETFSGRVVKTSIHELGHVFGLAHCDNNRCVMFFSFTLSDTDRKTREFCPRCRRRLMKKGEEIPYRRERRVAERNV